MTFKQYLELLVLCIKGPPAHQLVARAQQIKGCTPRKKSHNRGCRFPSSRTKRHQRKARLRAEERYEMRQFEHEMDYVALDVEAERLEAEEREYDVAMYRLYQEEEFGNFIDHDDWDIDVSEEGPLCYD